MTDARDRMAGTRGSLWARAGVWGGSAPLPRAARMLRALPLVGCTALIGLSPARAADPAQDFLGPLQPGRERPLPEAAPPTPLDFTIEAPHRKAAPRAAEETAFAVKDIVVTGSTVYPDEDLRALTDPLVGRTVHLSDLIALTEAIEAKYRADGYILIRAYVPAQSVSDGIFRINVVEGYVDAVSVVSGDDTRRRKVESLLAPVLRSRPLKLPVIERALLTANDLPGVHASGLLRPSTTAQGASDLVVKLDAEPYSALLSMDNRGSKTNGQWTNSLDLAVLSPLGDSGQILLNATSAYDFDQRHSFQGKYILPVGDAGNTVSVGGLVSHGQPEGAVRDAELLSDSSSVGLRGTHVLSMTRQEKLSLDGGLTWQSWDMHALGQPFSRDEWRVADINLTYQNTRFLDGVSSATVGVAKGIQAFGASHRYATASDGIGTSRAGGRPDFTKFSAILRRLQPLGGAWSLSATGVGQYALDPLLTGEEISFGGAMIGRGYDPSSVIGDHGLGGAFELRYDLDAAALSLDQAQLYSFYDVGKVWWKTDVTGDDKVESVGFGLRTTAFKNLSLGLELAHTLIPVATSGDGERETRAFFTGSLKF